MLKRPILVIALLSLLAAGAAQAQQALVFTAIPDEDETRLVERFSQYAKYFESKLGVSVKYLPVKSYPAAVTAFTNNQVQFAWFGGLTGVQARLPVPGSQALAQGAEDVEFKSYIIAHASTGLKLAKEFPKASRARLSPSVHGLDLGAAFSRTFHPPGAGQRARQGLLACRLLGRSQPHDPAGAVGGLPGRCAQPSGLGSGGQERQSRHQDRLGDLGDADLSRLSLGCARRHRQDFWG